jgi:hypothetical protein
MLRAALLVTVVLGASACAGVALAPIGLAALSGGASTAVRAGTEHTLGGAAYRTFSASLQEVRTALLNTFEELQVTVTENEQDGDAERIVGEALHREIQVRLDPITPALTRLRLVVRQGWLGTDSATASELIAQTARQLDLRSVGRAGRSGS